MRRFYLLLSCAILGGIPAWGQGVFSYKFDGVVTGSRPTSGTFFSIPDGTSIHGFFTVDSSVSDKDLSLDSGAYESQLHGFELDLRTLYLSMTRHMNNLVRTENGLAGAPDTLFIGLEPPTGSYYYLLRFTDPKGTALQSDAMITRSEDYNRFEFATLEFMEAGVGGSYMMNFQVTPIPEPTFLAFGGLGVVFGAISLLRRSVPRP